MLEYGIPKGTRWDDYLKNSKPPSREEILAYARKEEGRFNLGRISGYALLGAGILMMSMPLATNAVYGILMAGSLLGLVGVILIFHAYLFAQICFASIQRMWDRCEDQEAEMRKSIAQDL